MCPLLFSRSHLVVVPDSGRRTTEKKSKVSRSENRHKSLSFCSSSSAPAFAIAASASKHQSRRRRRRRKDSLTLFSPLSSRSLLLRGMQGERMAVDRGGGGKGDLLFLLLLFFFVDFVFRRSSPEANLFLLFWAILSRTQHGRGVVVSSGLALSKRRRREKGGGGKANTALLCPFFVDLPPPHSLASEQRICLPKSDFFWRKDRGVCRAEKPVRSLQADSTFFQHRQTEGTVYTDRMSPSIRLCLSATRVRTRCIRA